MTTAKVSRQPATRGMYLALAAFIMAYGWGYRGTVGHEGGAMVPGALLGLALCLGSGRPDWHRRTAVAGLFAAAGWAWGGSLSYMEQTFYVLSDSFPDVLYGYTMLFFLGGLWAGIGGGVLGLGLTEPRSHLEALARPFTLIAGMYLLLYVYFFFNAEQAEAVETFTVRHFHDGDWLPALLALAVSGIYWVARPKDRPATVLFLWAALAWWIGYLALTKFGGLRLGPLHRSESWGGVLGILAALLIYLWRRGNRAALMLCRYGVLGGGLAFAFAVFARHPLVVEWGPFQGRWPQWRIAEDTYGFFMGLAIALGAWHLSRGGLAPAREDRPRAPLDAFAVFVVLVALVWINFRRHAAPWVAQSNAAPAPPFLGMSAWVWYVFGGVLATGPVLYGLYRYYRGDRQLVPASAFGKGVAVTLLLLWITVAGHAFHEIPSAAGIAGHLVLWIPAAVATWLILGYTPSAPLASVPPGAVAAPSDRRWNPGVRYWALWGVTPLFLLAITGLSLAMQEGSLEHMGRKRFGPEAYWRQTARLMGTWRAVGMGASLDEADGTRPDLPIGSLAFDAYRNVTATLPSGEVSDRHLWFLKNQYTWLRWYAKDEGHPQRGETPLLFRDDRLYIGWPPGESAGAFIAFERVEE